MSESPTAVWLRRQTGTLMADSFFQVLSLVGRLHPKAKPERHGVEVIRDVPYRPDGGVEHVLDVYRPTRRTPPWPTVLYVHGGGFRILSKNTHWLMGIAFARAGYAVFNINYRLSLRYCFPAALEDACAALSWVNDHGSRFGADMDRLVLAGESAGANLVTALAVATCYERPEPWARAVFKSGITPKAVLPACGMLQVTDPLRFDRRRSLPTWVLDRLLEVSRSYLGDDWRRAGEMGLADPLLVLEQSEPARPLPPFFVPVGTKDPLLDDTRRLNAALDRHGAVCDARYYPDEMHAFHAFTWRPNARKCWRDTFSFLARHI